MTGNRRILIVLTMGALLTSTGCQAITTIFETGVWVGVILVLVIFGGAAFVLRKFRGGGGPPPGTTTTVAVLLTGTVLTAGAPPATHDLLLLRGEQKAPVVQQGSRGSAVDEVLWQGCVVQDTDGRSRESMTNVRGQVFMLRDASRVDPDTAGRTAGESSGARERYLLAPGPELSLSRFVGKRVEVRGHLRDGGTPNAAGLAPDHRASQNVQGGQMQDAGQTMSGRQAGQGGQSAQTTDAPARTSSKAGAVGTTGDAATIVITSARELAPTCSD